MAKGNDKRKRLVDAANQLFHQQGVNNTTLANIATLAEVPLGNVYYYFKSKESIIIAVIQRRRDYLAKLFADWNQATCATTRLVSLIRHGATLAEEAAEFGDSLGSLCQELGKQGGVIGGSAAELMNDVIRWCEMQFKALGNDDAKASNLAMHLVSSLQGMCLLTLTFKDPEYIQRQCDFLVDWLRDLKV